MHELHDAAVIECLSRCRGSADYRVCLCEYVLILQDVRLWERADAEEVGRCTLQAIKVSALGADNWPKPTLIVLRAIAEPPLARIGR